MKKFFILLLMILIGNMLSSETIDIGTATTHGNVLPMDLYYKDSITETIYFPDEIGFPHTIINGLDYHIQHIQSNWTEGVDIYVGETSQSDLSNSWISADSLNLVFSSDNVAFSPGNDYFIHFDFTSSYIYTGRNFVIMVVKRNYQHTSSTDHFYYTETSNHPNRTLEKHQDLSGTDNFDPYNLPSSPNLSSNVPNTTLHLIPLSFNNDLGLTEFDAPQSAIVGHILNTEISVTNLGYEPQNGFTINLGFNDGTELTTLDVNKIIESGETKTYQLSFTPADDDMGLKILKAEVSMDGDELATNNSLTRFLGVYPEATFISGELSGTLSIDNSPYFVDGNILITNENTLTIEPGVELFFTGNYSFEIQGSLIAEGTENDSIKFICYSGTNWQGIDLKDNSNANASISHSLIKNSNSSGIYCGWNSTATITNNIIANNSASYGGGIYCGNNSTTVITNNKIINNSASNGAGIYCYSNATITNNIIANNSADYSGGGISCRSNATITNNMIANNSTNYGGGIYCDSNATITNNTITNNSANSGGGFYCYSANPNILNTVIYGNVSSDSGNQVYIGDNSSPYFAHCDIEGDLDDFGGNELPVEKYVENINIYPLWVAPCTETGNQPNAENADYHLQDNSPCIDAGTPYTNLDEDGTITDIGAFTTTGWAGTGNVPDNIFTGGTLSGTIDSDMIIIGDIEVSQGTALTINPGITLRFVGATLTINGTLIAEGTESDSIKFIGYNGANWQGIDLVYNSNANATISYSLIKNSISSGIYCGISSTATITNNIITNNLASMGGGIYCSSNTTITDNTIVSNSANNGGGIYCNSNANITNNAITNNSAIYGGGGIYCSSNATITNNTIANNLANSGGGINLINSNQAIANNLIKTNNASQKGGAIYTQNCTDLKLVNNTVVNNTSDNLGKSFYFENSTVLSADNIIWNFNSDNTIYIADESSQITVSHCDFSNENEIVGNTNNLVLTGNITGNPQFVDNENIYFLKDTSPCINAGLTDLTGLNIPETDILGNNRQNGIIDIGAYEYGQIAPVINLPESISFAEDTELSVDFSQYIQDYNDDSITLSISGNTNILANIDSLNITFSTTKNWNGTETINISANDGNTEKLIAIGQVDIIVTPVNDAPVITSFSPEESDFELIESSQIVFEVTAKDIDSEINYSWFLNSTDQEIAKNTIALNFSENGEYEIKCIVSDGEFNEEQIWNITVNNTNMPEFTQLIGNYPNPFNPETTINFNVKKGETAQIEIYNILGQIVKTYPIFNSGNHKIIWNGKDNNNNKVGTGVFFYRLKSNSVTQVRKMMLLK